MPMFFGEKISFDRHSVLSSCQVVTGATDGIGRAYAEEVR